MPVWFYIAIYLAAIVYLICLLGSLLDLISGGVGESVGLSIGLPVLSFIGLIGFWLVSKKKRQGMLFAIVSIIGLVIASIVTNFKSYREDLLMFALIFILPFMLLLSVIPIITQRDFYNTLWKKIKMNLKERVLIGIAGKFQIAALSAYILSLVAFFLPISFGWNEYNSSESLFFHKADVNFFIAAINCQNEPIFAMILTGILLLFSIVLLIAKKTLPALTTSVLCVIIFIVLLVLIPDNDFRTYTITFNTNAYLAPAMAVIGSIFSFLSYPKTRNEKS